ncbi:MAG: glycosyltransferase [Candidatus Bathyarchaeota archaeon]|nr:glycosyltransferase [Candidatus Bathyarchaeota archaeon]
MIQIRGSQGIIITQTEENIEFAVGCSYGKSTTADATIETNASSIGETEKPQSPDFFSKDQLVWLLRKHGVEEPYLLDAPAVKRENVIPVLRKAKVKVPEAFFEELATLLQLPFLSKTQARRLYNNTERCKVLKVLPYRVVEDNMIIPTRITQKKASLAVSNPFNLKAMMILQTLMGKRVVSWYVASWESVYMSVEKVYSEIHKHTALLDLLYRSPDESAHKVLTNKQKYWIVGTLLALSVAAILGSAITFAVFFAAINAVYFLINPIKIYISIKGFQQEQNASHTIEETNKLSDDELPIYTVLVPVYREAKVLSQIMRNMYLMNYPNEKLDVKILMEEKDKETIQEAKDLGLFGEPKKRAQGIPTEEYRRFLTTFDPVVIPMADITTKPRACNYGLIRAKGKYCVIYDAEDSPDLQQLRYAANAFEVADKKVTCLQGKLNFYNANENLLTKWFSIEYSYWYDFYLDGLDRVDVPIPLGGTSNHFRIDHLRELGGWDPYNVTEDADLGVRIARRKLKTAMIETYTYEEATLTVGGWIKQRSRWYKGHVQTYLVHMRHPKRLIDELGWKRFGLFQFTFGGSIFMPVINPLLWILTAVGLFVPGVLSILFLLPIESICIFNLLVGNSAYLTLYVVACIKKGKYKSIPFALAMPIYWLIISIASWRGLIQLITKPFYWEKTAHGVTKT